MHWLERLDAAAIRWAPGHAQVLEATTPPSCTAGIDDAADAA